MLFAGLVPEAGEHGDGLLAVRFERTLVDGAWATAEFRRATDALAVRLDWHTLLHHGAAIPPRVDREDGRNGSDSGGPAMSQTASGCGTTKLPPVLMDYSRTGNGVLAWCHVGIGLVAHE